jgi:hypothetical protein
VAEAAIILAVPGVGVLELAKPLLLGRGTYGATPPTISSAGANVFAPAEDGTTFAASVVACTTGTGDFDGDGLVDFRDFAAFVECFGGPGVIDGVDCRAGDSDFDGDLDLRDYVQLQLRAGAE